jgi:plasmid stabilization system protein ParE
MKEYKVQWTKNAIYDLEDIIGYIKIDSIKTAKDIFYEIKDECQKLYFFPERKRVVTELQQLGIIKYRELIYKRWRIIFKIQEDEVFILLVADSSRNLEDILYQRLLKG